MVFAALMAVPVVAQERWGLADGRTEFAFRADLRQYGLRITSVSAKSSSEGVDLSNITLAFKQMTGSGITVSDGVLNSMDGAIRHDLGVTLVGPGGERTLSPILLRMSDTPGRFVVPNSADDPTVALILSDISTAVDPVSRKLLLGFDRITLAPELATVLGVAIPDGVTLGSVRTEVRLARPDQGAVGVAAGAGPGTGCPGSANPPVVGPDVIVGRLPAISNYGGTGGISAFAIGTDSCNIGDDCLKWIAGTNEHPVIAQNMYRLKDDRFEQIGMSWLKHGFTALTGSLCSLGNCTPPGTGALLGVGCSDPYSSSLNGTRSILGPRSQVNPHTGLFTFPRDIPNPSCLQCSTIDRRLQVHNEDLDNPGALYFVEGLYVSLDDAGWGNGNNNASYRPMFFRQPRCDFNTQTLCESDVDCTGPGRCANNLAATCVSELDCPGQGRCEIDGFRLCDTDADCLGTAEACIKCRPDVCEWPSSCPATIPLNGYCAAVAGSTRREEAGIRAWRDHDASVVETDVQIPGEGLLLLAAKAVEIGGGRWRYEYAAQNLNSDRGAGSFSIPLPTGAIVEGVGFNDVDYHSGEPYGVTRCMTCETTPNVTCRSANDCPNAGDRCLSDDNACPGAVCGSVCSGGINDGASCLSTTDCKFCSGGTNAGASCTTASDCPSGFCQGSCTGFCEKPPCLSDADCFGAVCDVATGICDNDWPAVVTSSSIAWSTTPYDMDPFANAIRWSTLYNFWFEANVAPDTTTATIGLFKPGSLTSVSAETVGPALGIVDCNGNGVPDACDIDCTAPGCVPPCGESSDCNSNGVPDEICEPDCNGNGIADQCDIAIAYGGVCDGPDCSTDCQPNTVPDECEPDCNEDGVPDECAGFEDCDGDGIGDCVDACPCTTPVGSCVCPNDGCCVFDLNPTQCLTGFTQQSCEASGATWVCDRAACRDGCLIGDWDADGDVDLQDSAAFQNCYSGPLEDPGFVAPSTQCLSAFDFDGDGDIDHADFKELEAILTDPIGVFTVCPGLCTQCTTDGDCDDANACTNDSCQGSICIHDLIPDCVPCEGSPTNSCDDGNACTSGDTCVDGVCSGVQIPGCQPCSGPADCDDGDLCTTDECVELACVFTPSFDEATECCDPSTGDITPLDDGDPCTVDSCDVPSGAVSHAPGEDGTPCDDGLFCNGSDTCLGGTCSQHAGDPCLGGPECLDTCDEQNDSCNTPASSPCTDDGNACTDNVCDGSGGCTAVNNASACDDGVFCNGTDTCSGGACSMHTGDPCLGGPACSSTCDELGDTCNVPAGTPCSADNNVCTDDACDGAGSCVATNNTDPCSDGDDCTINDTCDGGGFCVGTPSGGPGCTGMAEVCLKAGRGSLGTEGCFADTEDVVVNIMLTQSPSVITGGQVRIDFDPTKLQVISVTPGSAVDINSPFSDEIMEVVDNQAGTIFYVVGIALGDVGTAGPAVMGSVRFQSLTTCANIGPLCFAQDPLPNMALTDDAGKVPFTVCCSDGLRVSSGPPEISCPPDVTRNADAGTFKGLVTWDLPQIVSGCSGEMGLVCTATHSTGINIDHLIQAGGLFPVGTAEFACSSADGCGANAACGWTVQINPANSFEVMVQLSPPIVPGPLNRCIEFQFFANCLEPPLVVQQELQFGLPFSLPGQATNVVFKVPAGTYACVTARDPLHSLRSVSSMEILDGQTFTARFDGDPLFGGNWLVGGNLNGDRVIDILDFGIFIVEQQSVMSADALCGTQGPHADVNGDGIVDALDLGFVLNNFLEFDKLSCCPGAAAGRASPIREITVEDLARLDLADLAVADLNGDGLINFEDIQRAMRGGVAARPKPVRGSSRR